MITQEDCARACELTAETITTHPVVQQYLTLWERITGRVLFEPMVQSQRWHQCHSLAKIIRGLQ